MAAQNLAEPIVPLLDNEADPGFSEPNVSQDKGSRRIKAVHYEEPFKVSVKEVEMPRIEHPDDAIIKVTTAGSIFSC